MARRVPVVNFSSPAVALGAAGTDVVFACPALTVDQSASKFVPVQYLFDLTSAIPGTLDVQQQLSAAMQQYWTSFAAFGSPSPPDEPLWPASTAATHQMISLVPPQPRLTATFSPA